MNVEVSTDLLNSNYKMKETSFFFLSLSKTNHTLFLISLTRKLKRLLGWRLLYLSLNKKLLRLSIRSKVQSLKRSMLLRTRLLVPPKKRVETFVPRPKQKFVKAVYKVKCSVSDKTDSDNVVLRDKGQFFKYVGPNQVWIPKKV